MIKSVCSSLGSISWYKDISPIPALWNNFYQSITTPQKLLLNQIVQSKQLFKLICPENHNLRNQHSRLNEFQLHFLHNYHLKCWNKKFSEMGLLCFTKNNRVIHSTIIEEEQPKRKSLGSYDLLSSIIEREIFSLKKMGNYFDQIILDHIHPTIEIETDQYLWKNGISDADKKFYQLLAYFTKYPIKMSIILPLYYCYPMKI